MDRGRLSASEPDGANQHTIAHIGSHYRGNPRYALLRAIP
ncbi:hypothetical protein BRPE64_ACDS20990 [Caballeronia insecticola]|uniref:Uncharacterized protein n=1 Tax=Caballeronia insecticola TaxID=758793 RepID=R4WHV5_9BURK|nr:hypothetical protein BRPE64_ACDS20990 [Caballeronia insecticola]